MRQLLKYLAITFAILLVVSFDTSFFPALGKPFIYLNLTLVIGVFLLVVINERISLAFFVLSTLLLNFTTASLSLSPIIIGAFTLLVINWLFESFFTNRSYYTLLALGAIAWALYYSLLGIVILLLGLVNKAVILPEINLSWLLGIITAGVISLLFWSFAYFITTYMGKRFKSYFILSRK